MKYVVAMIQPDRLDEVMQKLTEKEIHLVTVSNAMGRGRQKGISEVYRSHKETGRLLKKVKLEIAVNDAFLKPTMDAILAGSRTGRVGDGKIFIIGGGALPTPEHMPTSPPVPRQRPLFWCWHNFSPSAHKVDNKNVLIPPTRGLSLLYIQTVTHYTRECYMFFT